VTVAEPKLAGSNGRIEDGVVGVEIAILPLCVVEFPEASVEVTDTLYVPGLAKAWETDAPLAVVPSPKDHVMLATEVI
jgi:hypothetical protein